MGLQNYNIVANAYTLWCKLENLPGGHWLFSRGLRWNIPYSGSLGADIQALEPGYARVRLRDRRRIRNHLRSIHAIALANLGELCSGIAMMAALPEDKRGIVTSLTIDYFKKARGTLIAESRSTLPEIQGPTDFQVQAQIRDQSGDTVAQIKVQWRLDNRA